MATIALAAAGYAVGGAIGGTVLGVAAATFGLAVGATIGGAIDSRLLAPKAPNQRIEGPRLDSLRVVQSAEGAILPRIYGRMRAGGTIIWATDFREQVNTETSGGGGKGGGGGGKVTTTEYLYFVSFALAICEGPISGIGRIWADGDLLDLEGVTWRWYSGSETQTADPFIEGKMGAGNAPAYRGTAYVVFEELPVANFGNRIPQISVEVFRPIDEADTAEGLVTGVNLIPATGEFAYSTQEVHALLGEGVSKTENAHTPTGNSDVVESLGRLEASAPNLEVVSLVVSWFGDDLRAGECTIQPYVETSNKNTEPLTWSVNGVDRSSATVVSFDAFGNPVFGGTPSDNTVVELIQAIKARGWKIVFYPFILMDVPPGNTLPNPYSDNAADVGQDVFPWRGHITCSPAAGFAGTVDKTAAAATQVDAFFGVATAAQFSVSGTTVSYTGPATEWGYRHMVLHYAHLCNAAGGVDDFVIGTELRGLTWVRSSASNYPAVAKLKTLAGDVKGIVGGGTRVGYAADWSEYFGHQPTDGTGDVYFHLDDLWSDPDIDFIGIDNYMPLSDWRDGHEHLDAQEGWSSIYSRDYLMSNIRGGEGYDFFYASEADRESQTRTPITDGTAGKLWVFRYKDLRNWWSNQHFNRPGGTESLTPTSWVPESKPVVFTEIGCPAIDRGTNQPNVFFDQKSSESFVPYFSRGWRDDAIQRAYIEATFLYWNDTSNNPASGVYSGRMLDTSMSCVWTWDARPYPFFPALSDVWTDGENYRLGHWLGGRLGSVGLGALVRDLCRQAGLQDSEIDVSEMWGSVEGYTINALESARASITMLAEHFGFDAVEIAGKIKFTMRDKARVAVLTLDDLVSEGDSQQGDFFELTREQETELPLTLRWATARSDEEFDTAMVEARRSTVDSSRIEQQGFPIAVAPEESARRCRRALQEMWTMREKLACSVPPSLLRLDAGDVVGFDYDGRILNYRLTSAVDRGSRLIEGVRHDRLDYDLKPPAPLPTNVQRKRDIGPPLIEFMNLPQLAEDAEPRFPYLATFSDPWPGEMAVFRSPTTSNWSLVRTFGRPASMGTLRFDFFSGPTGRWDYGNVLGVALKSGTLESKTDEAIFAGENALAIETAPGVWEIVQAADVTLDGPGLYSCRKLLRGQRGTEWAMGNPSLEGARVVVLGLAAIPIPIDTRDIGSPYNWRVGSAGKPVTSTVYTQESFTPEGRGLIPFSVEHVEQPFRRPRTPGDLEISWKRRDRALAADSWDAVEIPMSEGIEAYEVDIMNGSTVLRTLTSSTTSVTYTSADQVTDWGADLDSGDSLTVRIYQLSATLGRGTVKEETLVF